jgi:DNA-directed RNA polymerase specialized sigma subunit
MYLQMDKPNYLQLAELIKNETDFLKKEQLIEQLYVFVEPLDEKERDIFNYVNSGYIKDNPSLTETFINTSIYPFDDTLKAKSYIGLCYPE